MQSRFGKPGSAMGGHTLLDFQPNYRDHPKFVLCTVRSACKSRIFLAKSGYRSQTYNCVLRETYKVLQLTSNFYPIPASLLGLRTSPGVLRTSPGVLFLIVFLLHFILWLQAGCHPFLRRITTHSYNTY